MALAVTSLNGAITQNATLVKLTAFTNPSSGGIGPRTIVEADGEKMLVTDVTLSPTLQVVRGYDGTLATAHNTLAPVTYGLTTDFTEALGAQAASEYSYAVNATVDLPRVDSTIYLTKAGVLALTINGPNKDQTNTIRFVSLTANAHTITYTAGFYADTTSSDVATFAAKNGASATFVAKSGTLGVVALANVTIA